jgi:iduronate 2-sulfatase
MRWSFLLLAFATPSLYGAEAKMNVLYIVGDDLRCDLGCYGGPALSPNLDALAKRGVLFRHAYCQQAVCNPSRTSFMTGKRPDELQLWSNGIHFREKNPDVMTLPLWLKNQGYTTRNVGKIFHNWHTEVKGDPRSWSAPEFLHYANHGEDTAQVEKLPKNHAMQYGRTYGKVGIAECYDVPDEAYYDGRVANEAVKVLKEIKDQPFFLAVGFWKPHAPFNAPKKYWDLYQREKLPALVRGRPQGVPQIAFHDSREILGIPPKAITLSDEQCAEMRHAYCACISYFDAQLGKVLKAIDEAGLRDKTLIVFHSDHGYHLGERDQWAKTSNFELDARVPLLVVPPKSAQAGKVAESPVELIDLFPTVCDQIGMELPKGLSGKSLTPILNDASKSVKDAAYTQHPRPAYFDRTPKGVPEAMGYSVYSQQYRYTEWRDWSNGKLIGSELYDHREDAREWKNLAEIPDRAKLRAELQRKLREVFPEKK